MKILRKNLLKLRFILMGDILAKYRQLKQWQFEDAINQKDLQKKQLDNLLNHAYQHVPYYKKLFIQSKIIDSSGAVNLERFNKIPLLGRDALIEKFDLLQSDDLMKRKWAQNHSGGSTGQPVCIIQDNEFQEWVGAIKILFDSWSGYSFSDCKVVLWGAPKDLKGGKSKIKTQLVRWLKNEEWLNCFRMSSDQMHEYVKLISEHKPVQLLAYAEAVYELARFIEREKLQVISPGSIMTSAGTLYPHMRKTIEQAFNTQVYNRYGCRELGDIACECEFHDGLHISMPTHYVEVLRSDGSPADTGEIGEIVVTSLTNFAMPLIRYRIGDMGILSPGACQCGRSWPRLKEVTGRVTDVFVLRNGDIITPEYFIRTISVELRGLINKSQVVQNDYDSICIYIVPRTGTKNDIAQKLTSISAKIRMIMGDTCKIKYEFVEDIAPTETGKYRCVISKVKLG